MSAEVEYRRGVQQVSADCWAIQEQSTNTVEEYSIMYTDQWQQECGKGLQFMLAVEEYIREVQYRSTVEEYSRGVQ